MNRRVFLGALFALLISGATAQAQIARHAFGDLGDNSASTNSLTSSYTVGTGANRLLVVMLVGDNINGFNDITGVTYAGVSMSLAQTNSSDRFMYMYILVNPASGANNVVINSTNTHLLVATAADYTGVAAAGEPDATAVAGGHALTTLTTTITTVATNTWAVVGVATSPSGSLTITAGAGLTLLGSGGTFNLPNMFDTNGTLAAGSHGLVVNSSPAADDLDTIAVSFAPAAGTSDKGSMMLMGCCR